MDITNFTEGQTENGAGTSAVNAAPPAAAPAKEPEAVIQKVARHFKISNFIYITGVAEMAAGIVLGVLLFFVNLAGFRGYGSGFYYNMPRLAGFVSSLAMGLMVLAGFFVTGLMTLGFGKLVQAAEIYIQRRSRKQ